MYCPGGPDDVAVFDYVHKTVALDLAVQFYDAAAVGPGMQLPCPANTTTRQSLHEPVMWTFSHQTRTRKRLRVRSGRAL